jgi:hypothetical protein
MWNHDDHSAHKTRPEASEFAGDPEDGQGLGTTVMQDRLRHVMFFASGAHVVCKAVFLLVLGYALGFSLRDGFRVFRVLTAFA